MDLYHFLKKLKKSRFGKLMRHRSFNVAAAVVVFVTTYMLILPAITQTGTTYCGKEEHKHSDDCYTEEKVLICELEESEGHTHTDACLEWTEELVCSREESAGHSHSDSCYETEEHLTCTSEDPEHEHDSSCYTTEKKLVCSKEESEGHTHGEACYEKHSTIACGKEESEGHTHTDECYKTEKKLTCTKEEHTHASACYANPNADKEDESSWSKNLKKVKLSGNWAEDLITVAETQLGYKESTSNYIVNENGKKKGYTRYGAWYGNEYGDWCAMYVSFCLHYAGVPSTESKGVKAENGTKVYVPISAGCQNWIEKLNTKEAPYYYAVNDKNSYTLINDSTGFEPQVGNLIFFNWDKQADADHVGIVVEVKKDKNGEITQIKTIEGNSSSKVKYNTYSPSNKKIMGYAVLPTNPNAVASEVAVEIGSEKEKEKSADQKTAGQKSEAATLAAVDEASAPAAEAIEEERITRTYDGADFHITLTYGADAGIPEEALVTAEELTGKAYEKACQDAMEAMGLSEISFARFFNISFVANGEEFEPTGTVEVQISYDEPVEVGADEVGKAVHFADDGTEVLDMVEEHTEEGTVLTFEQESFSTTGTVYGVSTLADDGDDGDDGIALLADANDESTWSAAPAVGNLTGVVVSEPEIGEWYMLFGYNGDSNSYVLPETWPNRGSNGGSNTPLPKLSYASNTLGATVTYTGSEDMAWQYVGDGGFRNRYGYYMYMTTNRTTNRSWSYGGWTYTYTYSTTFSVTQNPSVKQLPLKYSWQYKAFYTEPSSDNSYDKYNILMINAYNGNGYSDRGDPVDSLTYPSSVSRSNSSYNYLNHYLAKVTGIDNTNIANGNHPPTTVSGTAELGKPVLYSMDGSDGTMKAVAGVTYTIKDQSGNVVMTVVTKGTSINNIVSGLAPGTYTVEQTAVPDGYIVTAQKRTITIGSGGNGYIGNFYVYKAADFGTDKTGQVIDYVNRIYQVELSAESGRYTYSSDPIYIDLVVDISNSMLFPAELVDTGKEVSLRLAGGNANRTALDNLNLDKKQCYYFIADTDTTVNPAATSTVYALYWAGSAWVYQDASFYSKAYRHWEKGDEVNVQNNKKGTSTPDYVQYVQAGDTYDSRDSRGGDITQSMAGATAIANSYRTTNGGATSTYHTFKLYTATEYNRLHELQQAVATLGSLVQSFNENSVIRMETFAKEVYNCNTYTMNNQGLIDLIAFANSITTQGGTRQDLALKHLIGQQANTKGSTHGGNASDAHLAKNNGRDDYVILITDGAPNTDNAATTISEIVSIAGTIKNNYMDGNDRLITVGLSSERIAGEMLPNSASSPSSQYYKKVEESGALTKYFIDLFYSELMKNRTKVTSQADIVDIISDSFYITDANGNALSAGDRIDLNGNPDSNGPGLVCYGLIEKENPDYDPGDEESSPTISTNEWYVKWDEQTLGTGAEATTVTTYTYYSGRNKTGTATVLDTTKSYSINYLNNGASLTINQTYNAGTLTTGDRLVYENGTWIIRFSNGQTRNLTDSGQLVTSSTTTAGSPIWKGHVYLKAKEDFIGGNTIDSNKEATVTLIDEGNKAAESTSLPTPTLNVRLLEMEGFESEETLFLGDDVTNIKEKLQTLLEKTVVEKIKNGIGNQLNYKEGATEANGCYEDHFTIPYAIRDLTEAEWTKLMNGEEIRIDYTYDDASSHGAVGYFSFTLTKEAVAGETSSYGDHDTDIAGKDVEKYTLTVTYTAYKIGEGDANGKTRKENVHNSTNEPSSLVYQSLNRDGTTSKTNGWPGTEVGGSGAGSTLETGRGTESVDEIHHVHVIDGEIFVTKVLDESMVSQTDDQTFTFYLYERDENGEAVGNAILEVPVTVKKGQTQGTIRFANLPRGKYIVTEEKKDGFEVDSVDVVPEDTSCVYEKVKPTLKFDIGTNKASLDGKDPTYNVIIYNETSPTYEQSLWEEEKRYVYSKPFQKVSEAGTSSGSTSGDSTSGDSNQGDSTSGGSTTGGGSTSTGTHTETREVETYAWESGQIISTVTSGTQYVALDGTTEDLNVNHTNYGVLTQSGTDEDQWTITWHTWTQKENTTTSYDWPIGTVISTDTSGSTYEKLPDTADVYDANHTDYGILKKNASDEWVIEWHTWSSSGGSSSSGDNVTITFYNWRYGSATGKTITVPADQAVTITYTIDTADQNPCYWTGGAGLGWKATEYTKTAVPGKSNTYRTTFTPTEDIWFAYSFSNSNSVSTFVSYSVAGQQTTWTPSTKIEVADTNKLPKTSKTTTDYSVSTSTETADNTKIPKTTKTITVEVPNEPGESGETGETGGSGESDDNHQTGTGIQVESVEITTLSAGHGWVVNKKTKFDADINVMKAWDDGGTHSGEEVYVVLYSGGTPVMVTEKDENGTEWSHAMMLKLTAEGKWKGTFTISATSADYKPLANGYTVREVNSRSNEEFTDSFKAVVVGESDVQYVTTASENGVVVVGDTSYNVHYPTSTNGSTYLITNKRAYELPETGGIGTTKYTMGGITLMLLALVLYLFVLRHRPERRFK